MTKIMMVASCVLAALPNARWAFLAACLNDGTAIIEISLDHRKRESKERDAAEEQDRATVPKEFAVSREYVSY